MALITTGSIISEIRGSIGDVTYSKNRAGIISKSKLIQPVSNSPDQLLIRSAVVDANTFYKNMSSGTKLLWKNAAKIVNSKMSIGVKHKQSAYNLYVSRWLNQVLIGSASSSFAPEPFLQFLPVITSIVTGNESIIINWSSITPASNDWLYISAHPPINQANTFEGNSNFRGIKAVQVSGTSGSVEIWSDLIGIFPLTSANLTQRVALRMKAISGTNFDASNYVYQSFIVDSSLIIGPPSIVNVTTIAGDISAGVNFVYTDTPEEGDAMIIAWQCNSANQPTPPVGWTSIVSLTPSGQRIQVIRKIATSSEPNSYNMFNAAGIITKFTGYLVRKGYGTITVSVGGTNSNNSATSQNASSSNVDISALRTAIAIFGFAAVRDTSAFSNDFVNKIESKAVPGAGAQLTSGQRYYQDAEIGQNTTLTWTGATSCGSCLLLFD